MMDWGGVKNMNIIPKQGLLTGEAGNTNWWLLDCYQ